MVIEYIRYQISAENQSAFLSDYAKAAEYLRASSVCYGYELTQCEEDSSYFVVRIVWGSTAEHLDVFRKSKEFQGFLPLIRPYISQIQEMRHYAPTQLVWGRGAGSA